MVKQGLEINARVFKKKGVYEKATKSTLLLMLKSVPGVMFQEKMFT